MFFIIQEAKETVFTFLQRTAKSFVNAMPLNAIPLKILTFLNIKWHNKTA